jgi:hypothetical protein
MESEIILSSILLATLLLLGSRPSFLLGILSLLHRTIGQSELRTPAPWTITLVRQIFCVASVAAAIAGWEGHLTPSGGS